MKVVFHNLARGIMLNEHIQKKIDYLKLFGLEHVNNSFVLILFSFNFCDSLRIFDTLSIIKKVILKLTEIC